MEQLARFQISIGFLFLIFIACVERRIPSVYSAEEELITHQGVTKRNGEIFSGYSLQLFADGDTSKLVPYLNGKPHGISKEWYENGILKEVRMYENGFKTGQHKGWFDDESLRFVSHFKHDAYHGSVKEWQANGSLYRDFNYENGQESGSQKMWESDGRLKANYVVRGGRMYGLVGTKNCLSTMP
jgi:antitoxin component YwqK of YwqJK toxin-antitoxin module